ncbi:MAG: 50S ribosomal protein L11 methyltransferase [Candidatus Paceibacterota bacterium]|jgi:predicted RNA methylase
MEITKNEDGAFSSIDLVFQCLIDEEKALSFEKIIKKYLKPTDTVIDIGTGSGLLALLAARAGARKVYAVEYDNFVAETAQKNIEVSGYGDKIEILRGDARIINYPQNLKADMVIMEMLTTGMVDEYQVQAINNFHHQGLSTDKTVFLPTHQETYVQLANTNIDHYGFSMPMIGHFWKHDHNEDLVNPFNQPILLNSIDFSKKIEETFKQKVSLVTQKSGKVNSLFLTSKTILDKDNFLLSTNSLNASVSVPLPQFVVEEGEVINLEIEYVFGGGYKNFKVSRI